MFYNFSAFYILGQLFRAYRRPMDTIVCTNIHNFWVKQDYFWVARVLKLGREYFWNASKLVRCKMSWMITNRHQKKQSNISCIPDGNVHAFHHKIFYLALKEFERESCFRKNMLPLSVVCFSHSLSVVLSTSLLLFWVLSCVSRSLRSLRSHKSLRSLRSYGSLG